MCGNRIEFMQVFLGCAWLGAVAVPINVSSRGFQLQHILQNAAAKLLCIEAPLLVALDNLELQALELRQVYVIGVEGSSATTHSILTVPLPEARTTIPAAELGPADPLAILYTSGTTGLSKGVCCPHGQYFWWGVYTGRQLGVREGDVLHTTLPLFHTNALNCFFQALLYGATQVVEARFSVSRFWDALNKSGATVTYVLGAMVPMLLSQEPSTEERAHSVRGALAPGVPAHFQGEFTKRTGIILLDGYGATESMAVIGTNLVTARPGYMGKVVDGFEAGVANENDQK